MGLTYIKPISGISFGSSKGKNGFFSSGDRKKKRKTDDKIQNLALARITVHSAGILCGKLIATVTSPQFYHFFPDIFQYKKN